MQLPQTFDQVVLHERQQVQDFRHRPLDEENEERNKDFEDGVKNSAWTKVGTVQKTTQEPDAGKYEGCHSTNQG